MRQLSYEGPQKLVWRDVAEPEVQADHEVVISTIAATTCDVDKAVIVGMSPFQPPFAIGHESVGRIADKGDAVEGFEVGDIVSIPYHRLCGQCSSCQKNAPLHCEKKAIPHLVPSYGFPHAGEWGGMFSEKYRVPWASAALIKLPDTLDPLAAVSLGDNLTDAWSHTVPHIRTREKAKVLITSFGGYGLYCVQWAIAAGAHSVIYVDDDPYRLRFAEQLGAEPVEWSVELRPKPIYDVIVNARPGNEVFRFALQSAAPYAHCSNNIIFFQDVPLPLGQMHMSGVTLKSSYCPTRNYMQEVCDALEQGLIDPRAIETEIIALDDVPERMAVPSHKPIVIFEEGFA